MDYQRDFQIRQSITIPMLYRLFVFIFRYFVFNIIRNLLFFKPTHLCGYVTYLDVLVLNIQKMAMFEVVTYFEGP